MKRTIRDPEFLKLLGERIKEIRKANGFKSQEKFAIKSKILRSHYSRYENGSNITLISLYAILKAHKMSFKKFFSEGFGKY